MIKSIIGMDVGTSNSGACVQWGKEYEVIQNKQVRYGARPDLAYEKYFPSFVQYDKDGRVKEVGLLAKELQNLYPKDTVYDIKRVLSRNFNDENVQEHKKKLKERGHYELCEEAGQVRVKIGDKKIFPEEVTSEIIRDMVENAFEHIKEHGNLTIDKAVITVPAYFNHDQKVATKKAAWIAFERLKEGEYTGRIKLEDKEEDLTLIDEPSAALLTYKAKGGLNDVSEDQYVLVFDLGAGTLDISIGKYNMIINPETGESEEQIEFKSIHGDTMLGGRDMDEKIIVWIEDQLQKMGVSIDNNAIIDEITKESEVVKIKLSKKEKDRLMVRSVDEDIELTREKLEELISPVVERCKKVLIDAIDKAKIRKEDIADVVLVGGPTHMPVIRRMVEETTGVKVKELDGFNPMLCVAEGAARLYTIKDDGVTKDPIPGVTPYEYGIAVEDPLFAKNLYSTIVPNSTLIPSILDRQIEVPLYPEEATNCVIRLAERDYYHSGSSARLVETLNFTFPTGIDLNKLEYGGSIRSDEYRTVKNVNYDGKLVPLLFERVNVDYEMYGDGLFKVTLSHPRSEITVTYDDLRPTVDSSKRINNEYGRGQNFGIIRKEELSEKEWERMAISAIQNVEREIQKVIEEVMRATGYTYEEAFNCLFRDRPQPPDLQAKFKEAKASAISLINEAEMHSELRKQVNDLSEVIRDNSNPTAKGYSEIKSKTDVLLVTARNKGIKL